jgi:hypothetical protein
MFYFILLYVLFFYFKLARVHKKEEVLIPTVFISHVGVAISAMLLYQYGLMHYSALLVLGMSFLFFIVAALNVTAVQLGIFKDGIPLLGINRLYFFMPFIALFLLVSSAYLKFF